MKLRRVVTRGFPSASFLARYSRISASEPSRLAVGFLASLSGQLPTSFEVRRGRSAGHATDLPAVSSALRTSLALRREVISRRCPSGDQRGRLAPRSSLVTVYDSPPAIGKIQTWGFSFSTLRTKAIRSPTGDHVVATSLVSPRVSWRAVAWPSIGAIQRCVR